MSSSLTKRDDIIANSYSLIASNGSVVDLLDVIQSTIVGLPSLSLNTSTKNEGNAFLDGKPDDAKLSAAVSTLSTSVGTKQSKFLVSDIPANTGRLFDNNSTKFKAITVASPLSVTTPNFEYLTISCDSYTKAEVTDKIAAVVGAAPALLDTLVELSAALNGDATYAATITADLAAKAPLATPTFTGTVTCAGDASIASTLTVSGARP